MFADLKDHTFSMVVDEKTETELKLVRIEERKPLAKVPQGLNVREVPFSLVFEASSLHEQRTYQVKHPSFESASIFMVPVGQTEKGAFLYQAIFT
ncbi:MAG: DUF6916 family protein [Alphaproteobacteria bacterium]